MDPHGILSKWITEGSDGKTTIKVSGRGIDQEGRQRCAFWACIHAQERLCSQRHQSEQPLIGRYKHSQNIGFWDLHQPKSIKDQLLRRKQTHKNRKSLLDESRISLQKHLQRKDRHLVFRHNDDLDGRRSASIFSPAPLPRHIHYPVTSSI